MQAYIPGPWHWRVVADETGKQTALILETKHRPIALNDPVIFAIREDWLGIQSPEREAAKNLIALAPYLSTLLTKWAEWARENTGPLDANSPHDLLIETLRTLDESGAWRVAYVERKKETSR